MIVQVVPKCYGYFVGFGIVPIGSAVILWKLFMLLMFRIFGSFFICSCYVIMFVMLVSTIFISLSLRAIITIKLFLIIVMHWIFATMLFFVKFNC